MKRERKRSSPHRSKYFPNINNKICSSSTTKKNNSCHRYSKHNNGVTNSSSDYFLRVPSSAHGSILSLGPLVYTWIGTRSREDIRSNCLRSSSSSWNGRKPCPYCESILRKAFRHFRACPTFLNEQYGTTIITADKRNEKCKWSQEAISIPCVELAGRWAEQYSLRHLCPNQCFLRAFAPSREWMILRKKLAQYTPIGTILDDWTCRLVVNETEEYRNQIDTPSTKIEKRSQPNLVLSMIPNKQSKQSTRPIQLRTEFVSLKSGEIFSSFERGRKTLFKNKVNDAIFTTNNVAKPLTTLHTTTYSSNSLCNSPFGLLEELFMENPWRLLISTILLNKTKRNQNIDGIIHRLFQRWPTAESVVRDATNDEDAVREYVFARVAVTGLGHNKSKAFVRLSKDYLSLVKSKIGDINTSDPIGSTRRYLKNAEFSCTREEIKQIYNCGDYAADAYRIFIRKDYHLPVVSNDYILKAYLEWKRS